MNDRPEVEPLAVGVLVLDGARQYPDVPVYSGVSYCDAVRRAGEGETLRILPGSIKVCRWSPVVLGLKTPEGLFEASLQPRLPFPVQGLLLAPADRFPGSPQVILVQSGLERLRALADAAPGSRLWDSGGDEPSRSALSLLRGQPVAWRYVLVGLVNRVLASLARLAAWQALTRWVFRSSPVTAAYDAVISRTMADMSVCRNSTVIPLQTGCVNVSYFCSGGITWGLNDSHHLTSGWPKGSPSVPKEA